MKTSDTLTSDTLTSDTLTSDTLTRDTANDTLRRVLLLRSAAQLSGAQSPPVRAVTHAHELDHKGAHEDAREVACAWLRCEYAAQLRQQLGGAEKDLDFARQLSAMAPEAATLREALRSTQRATQLVRNSTSDFLSHECVAGCMLIPLLAWALDSGHLLIGILVGAALAAQLVCVVQITGPIAAVRRAVARRAAYRELGELEQRWVGAVNPLEVPTR